MRVKCTANYFDKELNKAVNIGDELEVADARATVLVGAKVCEAIVEPTTPEVVTEPAEKPKKKAKASK